MNLCNIIVLPRENIFGNKEYDRATKKIYTICGSLVGEVRKGKIYWYKSKNK